MSPQADPLRVVLNRERLNEARAPDSHAVEGPFEVVLANEGEPVHVHLRFDGPFAAVAGVGDSNHYVEEGTTRRVPVDVAEVTEPVAGTLEIVTGHGAEGTAVAVRVEPPAPAEPGPDPAALATADAAEVDAPDTPASALAEFLPEEAPEPATLAVVGFALAVLVGALAVGALVDGLAIALGVAAVVVSVAVAMYMLAR